MSLIKNSFDNELYMQTWKSSRWGILIICFLQVFVELLLKNDSEFLVYTLIVYLVASSYTKRQIKLGKFVKRPLLSGVIIAFIVFSIRILIGILYWWAFDYPDSITKNKFMPSQKELSVTQAKHEFYEFLDSTTLIYSNYKYGVLIDFPDNWGIDKGVSEHTLIRCFQEDSAISYSLNVIELDIPQDKFSDIWKIYDSDRKAIETAFIQSWSKLLNTEIYNYEARKIYLKNIPSVEMKFNYIAKDFDYQTEMQCIIYQSYISPFTYTFGLHVPKIFYSENNSKYELLFSKISFLARKN